MAAPLKESGFAEVGEELGFVVEEDLGGGVEGLVQHGMDNVGHRLLVDDRSQVGGVAVVALGRGASPVGDADLGDVEGVDPALGQQAGPG